MADEVRMIDAKLLSTNIAQIAKNCARSDAQKALIGRILYMIDNMPTIEAEPANDWISVKDRLPDDNELCLICAEGGGICIAYYQPIGDKFSDHEPFWQSSNCRFSFVTHWQHLPEPPKGE